MEDIQTYALRIKAHVLKTQKDTNISYISLKAIDSFEEAMNSKVLTEENLQDILNAATNRHRGPYYIGTQLVRKLINEFPEIENTWRELANSKSSYERWVAISIISSGEFSDEFVAEVVRKAIYDKSPKVRIFANEAIFLRYLDQLLPELKKRADVEDNDKVLQSINFVLSRMETL